MCPKIRPPATMLLCSLSFFFFREPKQQPRAPRAKCVREQKSKSSNLTLVGLCRIFCVCPLSSSRGDERGGDKRSNRCDENATAFKRPRENKELCVLPKDHVDTTSGSSNDLSPFSDYDDEFPACIRTSSPLLSTESDPRLEMELESWKAPLA